jgi:carbon monoxide dehydrogenase subunit G
MTTKVQKTITVDVPISTAYNQWTQFEEFPQFMGGITKVEQLDDKRLHWVAEISGVKREWYATILEQRPDEKVAWAATEGATNAGAVYFESTGPDSTIVTLELEYEPEGLVEKVGDRLNIVEKQAESDLEKFKSFIESQGIESGGWRGEVEGQTIGSPGVESATTSQGDSGKAGISGKAAAAVGVAAAAAGVAAAAAVRSGSGEESDTSSEEISPTAYTEVVEAPVIEETTYTEAPLTDSALGADDAYGTTAGAGEEMNSGGVELDSTTPGTTDYNDGNDQHGTL